MKGTLTALLTAGIIYLLFAFYSLSFDPHKWSEGARFGFVLIVLPISGWVGVGVKLKIF